MMSPGVARRDDDHAPFNPDSRKRIGEISSVNLKRKLEL